MKKRHSTEQIVAMLRKADGDLGKGLKVPDVCKQLGISQQTIASSSRPRCGLRALIMYGK
jgi:hypothetical protein